MKITIVDYGMGNISSIIGALKYLGVGVIKKLDIDTYLRDSVLVDKKAILGICLGMQLMADGSSEDSYSQGLGFVKGTVRRFSESSLKVPHMGFNQVVIKRNSKLFKGLNNLSDFYFVHSFRMTSDADINQSECTYNDKFIAGYEHGNIAGVQFHPELSQTNGLKLLNNFITYF